MFFKKIHFVAVVQFMKNTLVILGKPFRKKQNFFFQQVFYKVFPQRREPDESRTKMISNVHLKKILQGFYSAICNSKFSTRIVGSNFAIITSSFSVQTKDCLFLAF